MQCDTKILLNFEFYYVILLLSWDIVRVLQCVKYFIIYKACCQAFFYGLFQGFSVFCETPPPYGKRFHFFSLFPESN